MTKLHRHARIGAAALVALALGLAAGWRGGSALAAQRLTLSKVLDLETIPGDVGERAGWSHVVYLRRADGPSMTRLMNELHSVMAERGWSYREMMPHMEDGDLKGLWIVYAENRP